MRFTAKKEVDKSPLAGYKRLDGGAGIGAGGAWIRDYLEVGARAIPRVATALSSADRLGALRVRLGFGRDDYRILPGLYAVGLPGKDSPVLVSANYKLSFDALRKKLAGEVEGAGAWILVIDTKGVNVWCAAGKGTFGTTELVSKIERLRLGDIVGHRVLVLPQLGAPGVSAPEVKRLSGFRVVWGPVLAADIPAFLAAGMKKTPEMSRVDFGLLDRLVLAPVELVQSWPLVPAALVAGFLASLPFGADSLRLALGVAGVLVGADLVATVGFPALLFALPTRSFAIKGAALGLAWGLLAALGLGLPLGLVASLTLVSGAIVSFIGMNFTGCTTFTSPTGALAEVNAAVFPLAGCLGLGVIVGIVSRVFGF